MKAPRRPRKSARPRGSPPITPRNRDRIIDRILKVVRANRTFFLTGHEKPDGDTIGSQLAFASLLRRLGKKADIYNALPVPRHLCFLPGVERARVAAKVAGKWDVAVVFECSGPARMGNIIDLDSQARTVVNIDHHSHHSRFGDVNLIDPGASSNSEQLFYFFRRAGMTVTREEATALYVGLVTDTGRFQQENTNSVSHEVAAGLHAAGIDVAEIARRVYATRTESALRLLGRALAGMRLYEGGKVCRFVLTRNDFRICGSSDEETEDLINHGLMIPSVQVAVFLREAGRSGEVKVSFRGKGAVDLCRVAVGFGGGGHRNASGCTLKGSLRSVESSVLRRLRRALGAE